MRTNYSQFDSRGYLWIALITLAGLCSQCRAEEIWLHNNTRVYGLIQEVKQGTVRVQLHNGEERQIPLEEMISIRFLGRNALLTQSGVQEFRFIKGGNLRGQIVKNNGDTLTIQTALAGNVPIHLGHLKGFLALPLVGFVGRKAEELVEGERGSLSAQLDMVLDRRGSTYPCVVSAFERTQAQLDYEETLANKPINMFYLAGVRLADASREASVSNNATVQIRVNSRDGSTIEGVLEKIHQGKWHLHPAWDLKLTLVLDANEIALVQILGGRIQYLSQLTPVEVKERSLLTPLQHYQMDHGCQGEDISIGGKRYLWGVGVHANSELTFDLSGQFKEFHCEAGVATRMGTRGSVVFVVLGDGKELFRSPLVKGGSEPLVVKISVTGVKRLTLQTNDGDDLDLSDAANWGSVRVTR